MIELRMSVSGVVTCVFILATLSGCAQQDFKYTGPTAPGNTSQGEKVSESFTQNKAQGEVDILIISDNSASMAEQQKKLGQRFPQFTHALHDIDYQIGIITTDVENNNEASKGRLVKLKGASGSILKPNAPNVHKVFLDSVTVGTTGSGNEQAMLAAMMSFDKRNSENAGFFRDNTDLAVLVLSDEDENSTGSGASASQVVQSFESVWGNTKRLISFGIIIKPGDQACLDEQRADSGPQGASYGTRAADLAQLTGGSIFSICDQDYSNSLKAISEKVRNLVFSIELSHVPVGNAVEIEISSGEKIGFKVQGKRIIFDRAPQRGSQVIVTYHRAKESSRSSNIVRDQFQ